MKVFIVLLLVFMLITSGDPSPFPVVKIGVLLPFNGKYPWDIHVTLPALELAVDTMKSHLGILDGYVIQLIAKDTRCSATYGPLAALTMKTEEPVHVFIGPACNYALAPVARFSPYWGIPLLSAGGLVSAFDDKSEYRLLTRLQAPYAKAGEFFLRLFLNFSWTKVGLLYHESRADAKAGTSDCYFTMEAISNAVSKYLGKTPWYLPFDENDPDLDINKLLNDVSKGSRVVALCASPNTVRDIMIKAEELKLDNGEYVFLNIDLFGSKYQNSVPWFRLDDTLERNDRAKKAYEALMTVTLRKPASREYHRFSEEVKRRAREKYENFSYGEEEVNSFVGALHDAVILYGLALNETLADKGNITDGAEITRRMWNRTFEGITGTVSIDANGDRNGDYSLLDLNPTSHRFEVVANYYGNRKEYEPVSGKKIHWPGGMTSAPPDTPKCGFDGSLCRPKGYTFITTDLGGGQFKCECIDQKGRRIWLWVCVSYDKTINFNNCV